MTRGLDVIADAIEGEGTQAVYALMGDANMHLLAELASRNRIPIIHGRHENAVVAMADGSARASGGVGVCSVTCGPGVTQIPTSLTAAVRHGTPLVVLAGDTPTNVPFHFQEFDIGPLVHSTGASFFKVTEADRIADTLERAFFAARTHRTTVVVAIPSNLQQKDVEWFDGYEPSGIRVPAPQRQYPDPTAVESAADFIQSSRRPVIVAGRGAIASKASAAVSELGTRIGALMGTTVRAKGLFRGSPFDLDIVGAFATRTARELLASADCVIGVGASLGHYTTQAGYLSPDARVLQIDTHPVGYYEGQFVADHYIRGDATVTVSLIQDSLRARDWSQSGYRTTETLTRLSANQCVQMEEPPEDGYLDPVAAIRALDQSLTTDTRVVIGGGHFWTIAVTELRTPNAGNFILTTDFGVISQTLPIGVGAYSTDPTSPLVVVEGDGSLLMNIQELETIARHGIGVVIFIVNDGSFGAERHKLNAQGLDGSSAKFGHPDFASIAQAFGISGVRLTDLSTLPKLLARQRETATPLLIDAQVSDSRISNPYRRLHFGQDV